MIGCGHYYDQNRCTHKCNYCKGWDDNWYVADDICFNVHDFMRISSYVWAEIPYFYDVDEEEFYNSVGEKY
jgi:hypothetical protein